jgi:DNA-binding Xre family transcriptional regulator
MNQIERLRDDLKRRFPDLPIAIDPPADESRGSWFLDVQRGGDLDPIVVEWRPDRGFGVSTPDESDYGTGVDEVYPNVRAAYDRVVQLILSGGQAVPPLAVRLADLRQARGLSQAELAEKAGVKQANVSRIEGRGEDIKVDTLTRIVAAMGGTLAIVARFPDGTERQIVLDRCQEV